MTRCFLLLSLGGLLWSLPAGAQHRNSESRELAQLPPAPEDFLLDAGGLFDRHPERRQALASRLRQFTQEQELPLYVAVYSGIIDSNLRRRARLLFDKWIGPEREGVVVVFNTDVLERVIVKQRSGLAGFESGVGSLARLADFHLGALEQELAASLAGVENRVEFVERSTEMICAGLEKTLRQERAGIADRSALRLAGICLVVGLALTMGGLFFIRRLRRADERARVQFCFPEVNMTERLGGPFCGGRHSVVDYSGDAPASGK